jgi:hypothetical protein
VFNRVLEVSRRSGHLWGDVEIVEAESTRTGEWVKADSSRPDRKPQFERSRIVLVFTLEPAVEVNRVLAELVLRWRVVDRHGLPGRHSLDNGI